MSLDIALPLDHIPKQLSCVGIAIRQGKRDAKLLQCKHRKDALRTQIAQVCFEGLPGNLLRLRVAPLADQGEAKFTAVAR